MEPYISLSRYQPISPYPLPGPPSPPPRLDHHRQNCTVQETAVNHFVGFLFCPPNRMQIARTFKPRPEGKRREAVGDLTSPTVLQVKLTMTSITAPSPPHPHPTRQHPPPTPTHYLHSKRVPQELCATSIAGGKISISRDTDNWRLRLSRHRPAQRSAETN